MPIRLVPDTRCREELGGIGLTRWRRLNQAYADIFPPVIEIRGRYHRDADLWERCKEALIARSDPAATHASAARARAARRRRKDEANPGQAEAPP